MAGPVHYEVYVRKTAPASWSLMLATEDRKHALDEAEGALRHRQAVAVRVTRETLDPATMAFASQSILTRGPPEPKRKRAAEDADRGPACRHPQDFYTPHARALIGRVLEDWLRRNGVTVFELLHRPDLAERLEASGVELQHAIQKAAVPESQASGTSVHDLVRHYQRLADQALERVTAAGRQGRFPDLGARPLAETARALGGDPERAFRMGGAISAAMAGARGPRARLDRLMDLAEAAPEDGPPRALALGAIEQILVELIASRAQLADILGPALDHGGGLMAVVRMAAPREVEVLIGHDPRLAPLAPAIEGPAARLAARLAAGAFPQLAAALARMVLRELTGPRRLRPADAEGEIDILRALAMALTATAGRLLTLEEVQSAFVERSRGLVSADFVAAYVKTCPTILSEAQRLTRLCENVTGGANKRAAARWLSACVTAPRFETEMRKWGRTAAQKLTALADLQRDVRASGLAEPDEAAIAGAVGAVGDLIEAEGRVTQSLARAPAPAPHRLAALLRLASGESAPLGPAAERARAEAVRLLRAPEARQALQDAPDAIASLRPLMKAAGLAA